MKRVKSNYHTPHVLKTAQQKLRKAIITNCNKELVNSISECILNVLNGNVKLSGCSKGKLRNYKALLRKVADKRVPLSNKKKSIVHREGFLLPLPSAVLPAICRLIFFPEKIMLRRMYLVPAEKYPAVPKHSSPTPQAPTQSLSPPSPPQPPQKKKLKKKKKKKRRRQKNRNATLRKMG